MWFLVAACAHHDPDLSPIAGALPACPPSPNCVTSEAGTDAEHATSPLPMVGDEAATLEALVAMMAQQPRTTLVRRDGPFLHFTERTRILRFVDDVTFRVDAAAGVVHVRSASRVGYGDLGVNRARVERLRVALGP